MNKLLLATVVLLLAAPAYAAKPCEELKSEIDAKLKEKKVEGYTLEVVASADVKDQQVVGSCEGGTKKIVYTREKK
jgi:uncharacterized protein DUF1161